MTRRMRFGFPARLAYGLAVVLTVPASGQEASVQGRVWGDDAVPVAGATVSIVSAANPVALARTLSDGLGHFTFSGLGPGRFVLRVQRLGYAEAELAIELSAGEMIEVRVEARRQAIELPGIDVSAVRSRERRRFEEDAGLTVREIEQEDLRLVPGLAEADPVRAVEALPGVTTVSDFSAAFNVRGGSADQNLVLLDGVPVFNPFHLGGLFSVFNADMVARAELQSGGFPARFGERVSSVLDIVSDVGDGAFGVEGAVSLLAARAAVRGSTPDAWNAALGLGSGRWRVAARRSYFDVLLKPFFQFPYALTDLQGVFEGWTRGGNRLQVTAYAGGDALRLDQLDEEDFPLRFDWTWGNRVAGARWLHPRGDGGALEFETSWSSFGSTFRFPDFSDTDFRSEVERFGLGVHRSGRPMRRVTMEAGAVAARLAYLNRFDAGGTSFQEASASGWNLGAYSSARWASGPWIVEGGLRVDAWSPSDGDGDVVLGPRLSAKRFVGDGSTAVKLSAGRYAQFVQSLRNEELPVGIDFWQLAGPEAPGVVSDQLQLGVERFLGDAWIVSAEAWARRFDGVITINTVDDPNEPYDDVLAGRGSAWGADLFVRKTDGATTGWLSLSLLQADRTFPDVRTGVEPPPEITWPAPFDRTVEADLVLRRQLGRGWEGGLRWNVGSGRPFTRPLAAYRYYTARVLEEGRLTVEDGDDFEGTAVVLGPRNAERYPLRHRLDVSLRKPMTRSWGTLTPFIDVLNVYNRRNVLFYFYEYDQDPPRRSGISMIPLLPTVGVEVRF